MNLSATNSTCEGFLLVTAITVLHIDDDECFLELVRTFTDMLYPDISLVSVSDPIRALQLIETGNYDAIISDYQMPGLNGLEVLATLRQRGNTIPFIILSGKKREEVVIRALDNGADFCLQKNGNFGILFTELRHHLLLAVNRWKAERSLVESERKCRAQLEKRNRRF